MRIGTRGSALALVQARQVADSLQAVASKEVELVVVNTSGDAGKAQGDKARWVDGIERALLHGEIDLAVHSAKDVPAQLASGLAIIACPPRASAHDSLCGAPSLRTLAPGATLGTSSLRRAAQLRALREDLDVIALHGNVDTRLRRLEEGDFDAIVLAQAGLERLGRDPGVPLVELVPAAGQGTLALQARGDDDATASAVAAAGLRHADTEAALAAERALVARLGADCHTAMGAYAEVEDRTIVLRAWIGLADGSEWIADEIAGEEPQKLAHELAQRLLSVGAAEMLAA